MKILKVIHGYPPTYNAGSEVYSQTLCHALADAGHQVDVITREENPFAKDFSYRQSFDVNHPNIRLHIINLLLERVRYAYNCDEVNAVCQQIINSLRPDIVHIGHLNHLSIGIVTVVKSFNIPVIYTIHDFWLMCPRGQFIQRNSPTPWQLCDGQDDLKCATKCYSGYYSGTRTDYDVDSDFWRQWISRRMSSVRNVCDKIDLFIAPSQALIKRYVDEFGLPERKIAYIDYGFDIQRLKLRKRRQESVFVFGYIGTHIPAKGIDLLIRAFAEVVKNHQAVKLRIWGRSRDQNTKALKKLAQDLKVSSEQLIEWMPEYANHKLMDEVFNEVDVIVVPSIWQENSPLVIHEALQARVGVITADFGGMGEYIKHRQNGWVFQHRSHQSLADVMHEVLTTNPASYQSIVDRGYLLSEDGHVIDIADQAAYFTHLYQSLIYQNLSNKSDNSKSSKSSENNKKENLQGV
ncbi:glycosyltransferase [Cysteiniphilum litorale]|uniref:Glycosyl transferase n=2 Tax=Cysteiniphilum TaxID=2056696 RepID=A0A8J3E895_9GAMM|nr:glycosyltransferase [Cysteiniphilum litorale]GGF92280.1 glycosyl transferase [Cysteiniphilum litorale]